MSEFWELSPAQVNFILEQHADKKERRGTAKDLRALAGRLEARR